MTPASAEAPLPAAQLDPERSDPHAAFLAAVRGLSVHRSRQLSGLAAPARLCRRCRVRQALRGGSARHRQLPRDRRNDRHRHPVGLYRARMVGDPRLWHLDHRGRLRAVDHQPRPALALVAARLLFRPDLGRPRPGDHRQDRRSLSRRPARHDPRRHHDRQRHRLRRRRVGGGLDLRPVRQLSARLHAVDRSPISAAASPSGACAARRSDNVRPRSRSAGAPGRRI